MKRFRSGSGHVLDNFQSFISFNLDHGRYHVLWEADNEYDINVAEAMRVRNQLISLPDYGQLRPLFQGTECRFGSIPWTGNNGLDQYRFVHTLYFREDDSEYRSFELSNLGHSFLRLFSGIELLTKGQLIKQFHAEYDCLNADLHQIYKMIVKGE